MPHVPLRVPVVGETTLLTPDGGTVSFPSRQLRTQVYLGGERQMRAAVIDTGAPGCILPRRVWAALDARGDVKWVTDFPARLAGDGEATFTTVFGGRYQYRLGRLRLEFCDGQLAPREVLVICTDDPPVDPRATPAHPLFPLLIGLADVMRGRTLLLQAAEDGQRWSAILSEP